MTKISDKILKPDSSEVSEEIFGDAQNISSNPCFQPKGGFKYVFEWKDGTEHEKGSTRLFSFL